MKNKILKILIFLTITGLLSPTFSLAQGGTVKLPENIDQAKEMGKGFLSILPDFLKSAYQEAFGVGKWIYQKAVPIWDSYVFPWLDKYVLQKIEKRKPVIEEEFQKEKEEMKEGIKTEVPRVNKTFWEKVKELKELID
jgi:hypothetical protein